MKHISIYNRLRRIEGQVRGIGEMVAKDRGETDILIQLEAVKSSLSSTIAALLEGLFSEEKDGKIVISKEKAASVIRAIKKSS